MRNMSLRGITFLIAAIILASLTGVVVYGVAQQAGAKTVTQNGTAVPTVDVVVAAADIPVRTVLRADMLVTRSYPTNLVPAGSLTSVEDAAGQTVAAPITKGQPLVRAQLASPSKAATAQIERGKVLVAFPTGDPLTVAGLVNVGDRVDIIATVNQGTGESSRVSQTTLQNLEVLDVLAPTKEQPQRATSLVFVVDHQVAVVMKYLRDSQAIVDLAIRSRAESEFVKTASVDLNFIVTTYGFRGPR